MSLPTTNQLFFRSFFEGSASGLVSGKGIGDRRLSTRELLSEFHNHRMLFSTQTTALVSVTVNFTAALRRAFEKYYLGHNPDRIWIMFISVPYKDDIRYHEAEQLARLDGHGGPRVFKDEYIFEWKIPEKYVIHKVSFRILLERGFDMEHFTTVHLNNQQPLRSAYDLRQDIAIRILDPSIGGYDIGSNLGDIARHFGARAPVYEIAHRILAECAQSLSIDYRFDNVRISYWRDHNNIPVFFTLGFGHFFWIERGIDETLSDFWLKDVDFIISKYEHCEWASALEDGMEKD